MPLYGWDSSHFDAPDARPAVAEGFSFLTHKVGGDAPDAEYASWWNFMRGYRDRVLLGGYWVLYPGTPVGRANAFIARLDAVSPGWRDAPYMLQIDCEIWGGDTSTLPGRADIQAHCDRLVALAPKLRPIVYAPKWAYDGRGVYLSGLSYPLWASSYVAGTGSASALYPGDNSSRWGAYSGQVPAILQFTSSATIAGQTTCDANAFRGTLEQLTALVAPGWVDDVSQADVVNALRSAAGQAALTAWAKTDAGSAALADAVRTMPIRATNRNLETVLSDLFAGEQSGASLIAPDTTTWRQKQLAAMQLALTTSARADAADAERDAKLVELVVAFRAEVAREVAEAGGADPAIIESAVSRATERVLSNLRISYTPPAAAVRDDDGATRAAREQAQRRIAGSGE